MDDTTRAELILRHMSYADVIAVRFWRRTPNTIELDELKSIAYGGLVSAANRWETYCERHSYDETRHEFFTAYVMRRMNGAILDDLRKSDWLSKSQRAVVKRIQAAIGDVDNISAADLAKAVGLSEAEVRTSLAGVTTKRPVSLDAGDGIDIEVTDITDEGSKLVEFMNAAVATLEPSEQLVLAMHYFMGLDFPAIAEQLGVLVADVRAHHTNAISTVYEALVHAVPALVD